jgi:ketosteroid isomerase-like protein
MASAEDLEAIRSLDVGDVDAVVALLSDDCVYHEDPYWLDRRTFEGREAVRGILNEYVEVWGTRTQTVESAEQVGSVIVAAIRQQGETPQGGVPIDQVWTYVFRMDEGLISELWAFADEEEGRRKAAELG